MLRAGGAKAIGVRQYARDIQECRPPARRTIAVVEAAGEIAEGSSHDGVFDNASGIASDDYAAAIRDATHDPDVKAIVLRVDSPAARSPRPTRS